MTVQVVSDSRISGIFTNVKLRVDRACAESNVRRIHARND